MLALEAENQLLKQQQAEWRRSQALMLRLAEEVQRRPLDGDGLEEPRNEELRQRVDRLRREKEDLVHRRTGRGTLRFQFTLHYNALLFLSSLHLGTRMKEL